MTRFSDAVAFAAHCHDGMVRKGTQTPYIVHPMEVAAIAAAMTCEEEILCAAVLHDVMEDCGVTQEELRERFGERTAQLVMCETQICEGDPHETWESRKRFALEQVAQGDAAVRMIALADKLSNMRAIRRDYDALGDALFNRFHQTDKRKHAWYYGSVLTMLREDMGETAQWREMHEHVEHVFGSGAGVPA